MTDNTPSPEALAASLHFAAAGNLLHDQLARAFDEFARQAVERHDKVAKMNAQIILRELKYP